MIRNLFKQYQDQVGSISRWLMLLAAVYGSIYALNGYIDERVQSPKNLELLEGKIRPTLIFNTEKEILYGKNVINNIISDLDIQKDKEGRTKKIVITTKTYLNTPPFLQCLDNLYSIDVKRGEKLKWEYALSEATYIVTEDDRNRKSYNFRLEILE